MLSESTREYDRFGPWILEVVLDEDIPPIFTAHYPVLDCALEVLKIPRAIERRVANPTMHLYDDLIIAYETQLILLHRNQDSVIKTIISYHQILAINDYRNLLNGEVTFYLSDQKFSFKYNTVSSNLIVRLLKIIRERYLPNNPLAQLPSLSVPVKNDFDFFYTNLYKRMTDDLGPLNILSYQKILSATPITSSIWGRIWHFILFFEARSLQNTLHLSNDTEYIAVTKASPFKRKRDVLYSYDFTYIPLGNIASIHVAPSETYLHIMDMSVKIPGMLFHFYFDEHNKTISNVRALKTLDL